MSDPQWEESGRREGLEHEELTGETGAGDLGGPSGATGPAAGGTGGEVDGGHTVGRPTGEDDEEGEED